jgi:hypothetical protein
VHRSISIRSWESNWDRAFKDLEDLFFSQSTANMASYLIENIDYVLSNNRRHLGKEPRKILSLLLRKSASSDTETRILLLAAPSAIKFLRNSGPNPDLKTLRRHLSKIVQAYSSNSFLSATRKTVFRMLNDSNTRDYELSSVIPFLLHFLLKRYSQKYVKDIPKEVFGRSFADIYKMRIANKIRNSQKATAEVGASLRELLTEVSGKLNALDGEQIDAFCEALYKDGRRWRAEPMFLFRKYRSTAMKYEKAVTRVLTESGPVDRQTEDIGRILEEPMRDVAREFIRVIILNIILKCLLDIHIVTQGMMELSKKEYPTLVAEMIKKAIYGNSQTYVRFSYLCADSEVWAFARSMSRELLIQLPTSLLDQVTRRLIETSLRFIMEEKDRHNSKKISHMVGIVETAITRFDCFLDVKKYLKELMRPLLLHTRVELNQLASSDLSQMTRELFNEHIRFIIERLSKKGINDYPDPVPVKDAKILFDKLFSTFDPKKERQWRTYFVLGDIDCKSKVFRIGKVTLYDARDWYFEETENFDSHHDPVTSAGGNLKSLYRSYETLKYDNGEQELKRNSARAFVDLRSVDGYTAAHKAELLVNEALDSLVFASSSKNPEEGFKPQLPLAFEVIAKSAGSGFTHFSSVKRSEMLRVDEKYDGIIEYYDNLARNHNIKFRASLLRALSLFRRGFWDESVSSQFRNYWIALEQLIENVSKTRWSRRLSIIELVPRLTVTWRDTGAAYNIGGLMRNVMNEMRTNQQLASKVSKHPKLRHWEKYPVIILENIPYLLKNVTNDIIKGNLTELQEMFDGRARRFIRNAVISLRQKEELRVGILKSTRNSLTHEGLTYFEADKIITHNLERLLVEVLDAFLSNLDAKYVDEIIKSQNRPMTIRLRS